MDGPTETLVPSEGVATGTVANGWPYVWGAYGTTWMFLTGYVIFLLVRGRASRTGGGR